MNLDVKQQWIGANSSDPDPRHVDKPSLLRRMRNLLRGWYLWCALAALCGIVIGAVLGYHSAEPIYRSTGVIEVQSTVAPLTGPARSGLDATPNDALLERQLVMLRGRQLIQDAMSSPQWESLGRGLTDAEVESFQNHLEVERAADTQSQIQIAFTDSNRAAPSVAVGSLIEAYEQEFAKGAREQTQQYAQRTRQRHQDLQRQGAAIKGQIAQIQQAAGPMPIERAYEARVTRVDRIESLLDGTRKAAELASARPDQSLGDHVLAKLAAADPAFKRHLVAKQELQWKLTELNTQMGRNAPELVYLRSQLAGAEDAVTQYVRADDPDAVKPARPRGADPGPLTLPDLRAREQRLELLAQEARSRIRAIKLQQTKFRSLAAKRDALQQQINESQLQLDQLDGELPVGPQIRVLSEGDAPLVAHADPRLYRMPMFAGVGCAAGLLLVLGIAAADRRMLRPDSAKFGAPRSPLLGTIPGVSKKAKPGEGDLAALCIHEIRALLQRVCPKIRGKYLGGRYG